MNSTVKQILIWVFMITCLVFLWQVVVKTTGGNQEKNISLTQLLNDADQGKIGDVIVRICSDPVPIPSEVLAKSGSMNLMATRTSSWM